MQIQWPVKATEQRWLFLMSVSVLIRETLSRPKGNRDITTEELGAAIKERKWLLADSFLWSQQCEMELQLLQPG